ncbi:MAG: sensor domain-containing diguanylate cyclase [Gammaproteobacteria bacterium]|nr:sensor domain-containing diguanylate cyclase [Gammaproteobacteria bacterium]
MKEPDSPSDETQRLETLRSLDILDTASEERFDRVTRMAKRMFDVPIAIVSLVDENRQWFKSCLGLDVSETSRKVSFCGHAILDDAVFVIEDATADPRFADNPLVVGEPQIRFYAGCPLSVINGHKLGTLCIIDRKPRRLSDEDIGLLRDLAAMVERELAALQMATLDELTGITNRRGFLILANYSLRFSARNKIPASLIFLDLDGFKNINDSFGHAEGDRALRLFADTLRDTFRESDVVARLGGDEFAVLLSRSPLQEAQEAIDRLIDAVDALNRDTGNGYTIGCSHGIVAFDPARHDTPEDLLADGDALMYEIKKAKP